MLITRLPRWVLVEKFPAFNDLESLTAIEQTARLYGKMNELIESYNKYVEEINKTISEYELEKDEDVKAFISRITVLSNNYINTVDMKIAHQDRQIAEVYSKFSEDLIQTVKLLISDLKATGELDNALVEAVGNLNTKVENLINECNQFMEDCNQFKEDMSADYAAKKAALESDYIAKKAALESDYTAKKAALDSDYAATKTQLDSDYTATKTQLDSDYTATKTQLDSNYTATKTQLESDYEEKKTTLENSVSDYVDIAQRCGKVLFMGHTNPLNDKVFFGEYKDSDMETKFVSEPLTIEGISKYKLLLVDDVLCVNDCGYIKGTASNFYYDSNDSDSEPEQKISGDIKQIAIKINGDTLTWVSGESTSDDEPYPTITSMSTWSDPLGNVFTDLMATTYNAFITMIVGII